MSTVASPTKRGVNSPSVETASVTSGLTPPSTFNTIPALSTLISRLSSTTAGNDALLEPQHLPVEASTVKIRLQKALAAIEALPDVDRTIEEQEVEIRELQARVRRQQELLTSLAESARQASGMDSTEMDQR